LSLSNQKLEMAVRILPFSGIGSSRITSKAVIVNDQPIQPLAWDGGAISYELEEHPLAALYSEVIRLGCDLAQCVDDGITRWRNDYWQEELAYTAFPPLRLICTDRHEQDDAAREEARELSGYPANIRDAAQGIFYGLRSAEQYQGYYRNLAEAIRERAFPNREALRECAKPEDGKPALYVISDRNVYAMAAAVVAWRASSGLIRWLEEGVEELDRLKDLEQANPSCDVAVWAHESPDEFEDWAEKYRLEWAISEADEREYAARCLGRAKRLLLLSEVADALDQATLDRLSLQEVEPLKERSKRVARQLAEARPKAERSRREAAKIVHEDWVSAYDKLGRADQLSLSAAAKIIAERQGGNADTIRKVLAKYRPLK